MPACLLFLKDVAPVNKSETDAYMDVHVDEEDA